MLEKVLKGKYNVQDVAFAVQSPTPSDILRDMKRSGNCLLPRKAAPGPGGGGFAYMNVVEVGLYVALTPSRKHPIARQVMYGLARQVLSNQHALRIYNQMSAEDQAIVDHHGTEFAEEDYPIIGKSEDGREYRAPKDMNWLVDFASLFFTEEVVSRDLRKPTFLIYNPVSDRENVGTEAVLVSDLSLSEAQEKLISLRAGGGDEKYRKIIEEYCDDLAVFNLTSFLVRIEQRLALRLKAREIRGE